MYVFSFTSISQHLLISPLSSSTRTHRNRPPARQRRAAKWIIKLANTHPDVRRAAEKGEDAVVRFVYGPDQGITVHIVRSKRTASQMKSQLRSYKAIPSLTIELCVKSQDGGSSFAVMPGCVLEGFAALADSQQMVQSFLKATDVGSMSYVFDEDLPTKVMRVFEGDTPGIAVKTEVVGVAKVIKGGDITAIEKEKTNVAAAARAAVSWSPASPSSAPAPAACWPFLPPPVPPRRLLFFPILAHKKWQNEILLPGYPPYLKSIPRYLFLPDHALLQCTTWR